MRVTLQVSPGVIAELMTTAIESGDPVTTACRGGWCSGIYWKSKRTRHAPDRWYADAAFWAGRFLIEVAEYDEATHTERLIKVHRGHVAKGLAIMASRFGRQFAQIMHDEIDAPCADIFLQCVLFGEEKYA